MGDAIVGKVGGSCAVFFVHSNDAIVATHPQFAIVVSVNRINVVVAEAAGRIVELIFLLFLFPFYETGCSGQPICSVGIWKQVLKIVCRKVVHPRVG
jgi:hypothetical protein